MKRALLCIRAPTAPTALTAPTAHIFRSNAVMLITVPVLNLNLGKHLSYDFSMYSRGWVGGVSHSRGQYGCARKLGIFFHIFGILLGVFFHIFGVLLGIFFSHFGIFLGVFFNNFLGIFMGRIKQNIGIFMEVAYCTQL